MLQARVFLPILVSLTLLANGPAGDQMAHEHKVADSCADLTLACAANVTPTFAADGTLWIVARTSERVFVANSKDRGRTFSAPVLVTPEPMALDTGPDARPKIVVDRKNRIVVAFAVRDKKFNGRVFVSTSADKGETFSTPDPITQNEESQRFETLALDSDGRVFAAWIDKRNRVPAREKGQEKEEDYKGAALAFAWSNDHGVHFSEAKIAQDHTCECCRIGVGFAGAGKPVVVFRNLFEGGVRDHAITTFTDPTTPGPVHRVSVDDWAIDACPHHGPALAIEKDHTYHVAWFTKGRVRQGLYYARSADGGASFSEPLAIGKPDSAPGRPNLLAVGGKVYLAWKEFDGAETTILVMMSNDSGRHWSSPHPVASTSEDSDHPILVADNERAFLSWQTRKSGYRLLPLGDAS
jgi:hypothetical protein